MEKLYRVNLAIFLFVFFFLSTNIEIKAQYRDLPVEEQQPIKEFVVNFFQQLEETRDFTPLIDEHFVNPFGKCNVEGEVLGENAVPTGALNAFNLAAIDSDLLVRIPNSLMRRFFIASLNGFYFYYYTPSPENADDEYKIILDKISNYVKKHPDLKTFEIIKTLNQLKMVTEFEEYRVSLVKPYIENNLSASIERYRKRFFYDQSILNETMVSGVQEMTLANYDVRQDICPLSSKDRYYSTGIGNFVIFLIQSNSKIKVLAIFPDPS